MANVASSWLSSLRFRALAVLAAGLLALVNCPALQGQVEAAGRVLVRCGSGAELSKAFTFLDGHFKPTEPWKTSPDGMSLDAPLYRSLPESALDMFEDNAEAYWLSRWVPMWRYALAGQEDWRDYAVDVRFRIARAAPADGYRAGDCFVSYQWGRENPGLDMGVIVRYRDPTHFYMVRVSSAYGHVELWIDDVSVEPLD